LIRRLPQVDEMIEIFGGAFVAVSYKLVIFVLHMAKYDPIDPRCKVDVFQ
jgi:hypothetical protein